MTVPRPGNHVFLGDVAMKTDRHEVFIFEELAACCYYLLGTVLMRATDIPP